MGRLLSVGARLVLCGALVLAAFPSEGRVVAVPTLPSTVRLDTEVSTNVVLNRVRSDVRRLDLHLELAGSPTNDLEVAFGTDFDADGVLGIGETEAVYGWRGGRYFVENVREWDRIVTEAATNAPCGVLDVRVETDADIAPRRFSAVCGGGVAFPGLPSEPAPAWLYRRRWNMARITRRGAEAPSDWVRVELSYGSFVIKLR